MKTPTINITNFLVLLITLIGLSSCTKKNAYMLQSYSGIIKQIVTSSTLAWETYSDPARLEYAVVGGEFISENENESYKLYVCRAESQGIIGTGNTKREGDRTVCVVSLYTNIKAHHAFEILINAGNLAKLVWQPWSQFSAAVPKGIVFVTDKTNEQLYIARHRKKHDEHHVLGEDFVVGKLDTSVGFGKVFVVDNLTEFVSIN